MNEPAWLLEKWWDAATTGTGFDIPDGSAFAAGIGDHEITLPLSKQHAALIALAPEMAEAILAEAEHAHECLTPGDNCIACMAVKIKAIADGGAG